jgi:hypothetical protein
MNSIAKTILIISTVLLTATAGVISKTIVQKNANLQNAQSTEDALRQVAQDINKTTPIQIDKNTQLANVVALGNTLRYKYTLLNAVHSKFEKNSISKSNGDRIRNNVCSTAGMQPIIQLGATLEYAYYDKDGVELEIVKIETSKCK